MRLKTIAVAMTAALAAQGAFADSYSGMKLAEMKSQVKSLQKQVDHLNQNKAASADQGKSQNQGSSMANVVTTDAALSQMLNGDQQLVGQEMSILQADAAGNIHSGLTLGGTLQADAMYDHSSGARDNGDAIYNNPYFDSIGGSENNRSAVTLTNLKVSMLANFNHWANAVVQVGDYYPTKDVDTGGNQKLTVQQAYILLGNLNKTPFYGFIGKRYISFGQFANVNPFTQPFTRQFFQANGDTAGVGYTANNWNFVLSGMNGGEHDDVIYATNGMVSQNMFTASSGRVNNFAANVGYGQKMDNGVDWHLGAGYLYGGSPTISHVDSNGNDGRNGVYDINGRVSVKEFDFYAEYLRTTKDAYTTNNRASGWQLAGDYNFPLMGHKSVASLSYSRSLNTLLANDQDGQVVAGLRSEAVKNVWTGIEYAYQKYQVNTNTHPGVAEGADVKNQSVTLDVKAYF